MVAVGGIQGDADAAADVQHVAVDHDRLGQCAQQALEQRLLVAQELAAVEQDKLALEQDKLALEQELAMQLQTKLMTLQHQLELTRSRAQLEQQQTQVNLERTEAEDHLVELLEQEVNEQTAFLRAEQDKLVNMERAVELTARLAREQQLAAQQAELAALEQQTALNSLSTELEQQRRQAALQQAGLTMELNAHLGQVRMLSAQLVDKMTVQRGHNQAWLERAREVLRASPAAPAVIPTPVYRRIGTVVIGVALLLGVTGATAYLSGARSASDKVDQGQLKMSYLLESGK